MALLEPSLPSGFCGSFADEIVLYYCCTSADTKTYHMFLSDSSSREPAMPQAEEAWADDAHTLNNDGMTASQAESIRPKYAVEIQPGIAKHQITLRSGTSGHDPPLALAGNVSGLRSTPLVALPPTLESPTRNKVVPIDQSSKGKKETWTFAAHTSTSKFLENFQWRISHSSDDIKQQACPRELVRIGSTKEPMEEVVATWTPESTPIDYDTHQDGEHAGLPRIKYGTLRFVGAGRGEGLGAYWRLLTAMTVLRMSQEKWDTLTPVGPVDAMRMRARKAFGLSVDVGMGMLASGAWSS